MSNAEAQSEAVSYASRFLSGWRATPGSITWARECLGIGLAEEGGRRPPRCRRCCGTSPKCPGSRAKPGRSTSAALPSAAGSAAESQSWSLVAINPADATIVALEGYEQERPSPQEVLYELLEAMRRPRDREPLRPECIQVRLKTYYDAWRGKLQQVGIRCELCRHLEELVLVVERLEQLGGSLRPTPEELQERLSEARDLPQEPGEIWQADIRRLATWVTDDGPPQRPSVAIVTCPTADLIVAQELAMRGAEPEWLWDTLLTALFAPALGLPHRPEVIEVVSPEFRAELTPQLESLGIRCVVRDDLTHLDQVMQALHGALAAEDTGPALIDTPGVTPDHVGGLFTAAAEFYRHSPWRSVPGDTPIRIHCPRFQTSTWYAVVIGQQGVTLGLALYEDLQVLQLILTEKDAFPRSNAGLSVMYSEAFEISVRDLAAAEEHGWPVAGPEAYPLAIRVNPGMAIRPPLVWEVELLEACLRAIPVFLKRPDRSPARMAVPVTGGELDMELSWLPPQR